MNVQSTNSARDDSAFINLIKGLSRHLVPARRTRVHNEEHWLSGERHGWILIFSFWILTNRLMTDFVSVITEMHASSHQKHPQILPNMQY
jgi:hypothetical protein